MKHQAAVTARLPRAGMSPRPSGTDVATDAVGRLELLVGCGLAHVLGTGRGIRVVVSGLAYDDAERAASRFAAKVVILDEVVGSCERLASALLATWRSCRRRLFTEILGEARVAARRLWKVLRREVEELCAADVGSLVRVYHLNRTRIQVHTQLHCLVRAGRSKR